MAKYKIIPSSRTIVRSPISIGHKAEKGVQAIEFDLTAWVDTYGSGTLTVIMRRWGDAIPYPIALEIDENNKATWTLSSTDTAKAGMAYAQLSYIVGGTVVKKSDIYTFRVMDSLTGEGEPPEAYESWLEQLTHIAAEAMAEVLDIEGIVTDKTLTVDGGIADGKATGDALALKADKATTYTKTEVDALIKSVDVETDTTLSVSGKPADAKTVGDELGAINESLDDVKADLSDLQDGGYVADQQKIQEKIDDWLNEHPEATTTVQDCSITIANMQNEVFKLNQQHFGVIDNPEIEVYADVVNDGNYFSAQSLHKFGNYYIALNACTTSIEGGSQAASEQGCQIIVLNNLFVELYRYTCYIGHANSGCILGNYLYVCGDAYNFKFIITKINLQNLIAGTYTAEALTVTGTIAIYSICTDGTDIYGSSGINIWKLAIDDENLTVSLSAQCTISLATSQDIVAANGDSLYTIVYNSNHNRNRIFEFSLKTGELLNAIIFPYNMGAEFVEIQSILNIGSYTDPQWLVYFNGDIPDSNYIAYCQFKRSNSNVIREYWNKPYLPIPFTTRDYNLYYKPSHHGRITGTAEYPFNSQNTLQRALSACDRYAYVRVLEDISELTLINCKKQVMIGSNTTSDYNHKISTLKLYYCDIVDIYCQVDNLTCYKDMVIQYANSTPVSAVIDYVDRFMNNAIGTTITHARNSYVESFEDFSIVDTSDTTIKWTVKHDNIDALKNPVTGIVYKDNGGTTNNTPGSSRGIVEIESNLGQNYRFDMVMARFTTTTGNVYINTAYCTTGGTLVWQGWKQIATTSV